MYTPFRRYLLHRYPYMYTPSQLAYMTALLTETEDVPGNVIEVGCAAGATTVFFARHLYDLGSQRRIYAYDTFSGFSSEDIDYELNSRAVDIPRTQLGGFQINSFRWVERSILLNRKIVPVVLTKADATTHQFKELDSVSFALIDVDIYRPTANSLAQLWPRLSNEGVIVVDDCQGGAAGPRAGKFGGGHAALVDFANEHAIHVDYVENKLGVIRNPSS